MNILVTGGAGFIGSHLVDALLAKGHQVTIVDNLSTGTDQFIPKNAAFVKADVRDKENMDALFAKNHFDAVYHEAAQTLVPHSIEDPYFDSDENTMGLLSILEACRKHGVKKIIFSSSAAIYGDNLHLPLKETEIPAPTSFYGLTKRMTEEYLALYHRYYGLHYTVLRYSNVYGPRQGASGEGGVIYIFAKRLAENKDITIFGDGKQTRDFISVHDVVSANLAALTNGNESICNVSTASEISLTDLALKMVKLIGRPASAIKYGDPRPGDIVRSSLSNEKAKELLHWKPSYSLDEGLKDTLQFFLHKAETSK
jgi:UDP-glucose 4-epimerase